MFSRLPDGLRRLFDAARLPDSTMLLGAAVAFVVGGALVGAGMIAASITNTPPDVIPALPEAAAPIPQSAIPAAEASGALAASSATSPTSRPQRAVTAAKPVSEKHPAVASVTRSDFDGSRAMITIEELTAIGSRKAGSEGEKRAAEYVVAQLEGLGYSPEVEEFRLPGGPESRNVVVRIPGVSKRTVVIGAHLDAAGGTSGSDASGVAAALEIARILKSEPTTATVEMVFFGSGAPVRPGSTRAHFGARTHVGHMSAEEQRATAGMLALDRLGDGREFAVLSMGIGPLSMRNRMLELGARRGEGLVCAKDPDASGSSDHEAYEMAGIPAAWLTWRGATGESAAAKKPLVRKSGQFALDLVRSLDEPTLENLCTR